MSEIRAWLEGKLRDVLPRADLAPGDVGRDLNAIAEAIGALEGRGGTAFGLQLGPDERRENQVLLPALREGLASWRRFLTKELGEEGEHFVDDVMARFGLLLPAMPAQRDKPLGSRDLLDDAQRRAGERLAAMLSDGPHLTAHWATEGQLIGESDQVRVSKGEPNHEQLAVMVEAFEERIGVPCPVDLAHTLSVYNGLAVHSSECAGTTETVHASDLSEPTLWPANVYGDHLMLADANLAGAMRFFVIGELVDSGYLALGIDEQATPPGVYWIDREMSAVPPVRIADGFSDFLMRWCDAGLCLPILLGNARIPGWGA